MAKVVYRFEAKDLSSLQSNVSHCIPMKTLGTESIHAADDILLPSLSFEPLTTPFVRDLALRL